MDPVVVVPHGGKMLFPLQLLPSLCGNRSPLRVCGEGRGGQARARSDVLVKKKLAPH